MSYAVRFTPEALDQLDRLEEFIALAAHPFTAVRYVDEIVTYCQSLETFPMRGMLRDDLMPGLRITNYHGRTVVAFVVDTRTETVSIVGVFYGGRDYAALLDST